jgi:hypothetical protein
MKFFAGVMFGLVGAFGVVAGVSQGAYAPPPPLLAAVSVAPETTTTTTSTVAVAADARCPQWWDTAVAAGWDAADLADLDAVLWRESRCDETQNNSSDPNTVDGITGSVGLAQVNVFWVQGTKWYPNGYLQTVSVVSGAHDLYDPFLNLRAAKAIFDYDKGEGRCGWSAWAWKGCD